MEPNINQNTQSLDDYIIEYINKKIQDYQNNVNIIDTHHITPHTTKTLDIKTWNKYINVNCKKYLNVNRKKSKRFTIEI